MTIYFSRSSGGFYSSIDHGARRIVIADTTWQHPVVLIPDPSWDGEGDAPLIEDIDMLTIAPSIEIDNPDCRIPADAVEISAEQHQALLDAQSAGQLIVAGDDGCPIAQDRPEPSPTDLAARRRAEILIALGEVDATGTRAARAIAIAMATGATPASLDVSALQALEAQAVALRTELASLGEVV